MSPDELDRILGHPLFESLAHGRLAPTLQSLRIRRCIAGESVAEPIPPCPALLLVLSGRLQTFEITSGGRRIVLDLVGPGGVDGFLPLAGLRGHFTEAATVSEIVPVPRPVVDDLLEAEPRLALNLFTVAIGRLRRSDDHLARMSLRHPSQRIAAQLLATSEPAAARPGEALGPRLSHEVLADLLGLRRETVTLHLARLRRMGALSVEARRFRLNVPLLEAIRDADGEGAELAAFELATALPPVQRQRGASRRLTRRGGRSARS